MQLKKFPPTLACQLLATSNQALQNLILPFICFSTNKRVLTAGIGLLASYLPLMSPPASSDELAPEPPPPPSEWKHQVELGLNSASGNTEAMSLHTGYDANYADQEDRWKFSSAYDRSKSDGKLTGNLFFSDLKKEWLWPDYPWFSFLQGRYDWNRFKEWKYRLSLSSGIGYQHFKNEAWDIRTRLGLGGNLTRGDDIDVSTPELILALDLDWTISEKEAFEFTTAFYPDLKEKGEYRNLSKINWVIKMAEANHLSIKLGLSNEYNSAIQGQEGESEGADSKNTEKNDFAYHLSLAWQL
jgi:putative salt-induced outer membrane protein